MEKSFEPFVMMPPSSRNPLSGGAVEDPVDRRLPFCSSRRRSLRGGFSLVEIVMAIGIVAFAFVTILGLIPTGLNTFRSAMDTSVSERIFRQVINEAQQTDFDTLVGTPPVTPRYFDNQGNEVAAATTAIYQVHTRITPSTVLPAAPAPSTANIYVATVTVQVAKNPGKIVLPQYPSGVLSGLWKMDGAVAVSMQSTAVARNQ